MMDATIKLSKPHRIALTFVVMIATLMQVVDTTIANVALPHMQAALGATPDTVTWVLTAYIIASAIMIPLSGWLEARIGRRELLLLSIGGFTIASILCGMATSLEAMVAARIVQGIFGAFLGPLSQTILLDIHSLEQRPKAMAIAMIVVMAGPILGPILGGYITDEFNWRWIFFVNVPIGVFSLVGSIVLMPRARANAEPFDAWGFLMIATGLTAFQLMLDRGTQKDWFGSPEIIGEAGLALAMFWAFAIHTFTSPKPLLPKRLFLDRSLMVANLFMIFVAGTVYASAAILPPMLQTLFGYDTVEAGLLMSARAITVMIASLAMVSFGKTFDGRLQVALGMILVGISLRMMAGFSLDMDSWPIILSGLIQGLGLALIIMPVQMAAFATLTPEDRTSGAALFNLTRMFGSSVSIAIFVAITARNLQINHSELGAHLDSIRYGMFDGNFPERMGVEGNMILEMIDLEVNRQAMMIAYVNDFWLMAMISFLLVPFALLLPSNRQPTVTQEPMTAK